MSDYELEKIAERFGRIKDRFDLKCKFVVHDDYIKLNYVEELEAKVALLSAQLQKQIEHPEAQSQPA